MNSALPMTGFSSASSRAVASGLEEMVLRSRSAVEARAVSASALRKIDRAAAAITMPVVLAAAIFQLVVMEVLVIITVHQIRVEV